MNVTKNLFAVAAFTLSGFAVSHAQTIIFQDDFSGAAGTVAANSTPEVGSGSWIGGLVLDGSGHIDLSTAGTSRFDIDESQIASGATIILEARIDMQGRAGTFSIGFNNASTTSLTSTSTGASPFFNTFGSGGMRVFGGKGVQNGLTATPSGTLGSGFRDVTFTFDTSNHFAELAVEGIVVSSGTLSFTSVTPDYNFLHIGIAGASTGRVDSVTVSTAAIPEASTYGLLLGLVGVSVVILSRRQNG